MCSKSADAKVHLRVIGESPQCEQQTRCSPASAAEIEEKQKFIDGVVEDAEKDGRDLSAQEMEMVTRARDRQGELNKQAGPMQEAAQIAAESPRHGSARSAS